MNFALPTKPFRTHGGADVPRRKDTRRTESVPMPPPEQVVLPMQQHIGRPCAPTVRVGDAVAVGQKIADSAAFVSAPIHATVSGVVSGMKKVSLPGGQTMDAAVIDSDGKMTVSPDVRPPKIESLRDFLGAVRDSGLVGLGGAGFPTHVKLTIPEDRNVDTLILNAAECEPYITSDHRCALEETGDILAGICAVKRWLGLPRVVVGVEDNKPDVIEKFRSALRESGEGSEGIGVLGLRSRYPQGAEKVLIRSCTGRRVPMGKLPSDAGCIVMNVSTAAALGVFLRTGMPVVKRRLTVDGSAVKNPQNVIVPVGTGIRAVVDFCGGYKTQPKKILMGGPMMGVSVADDSLPVLKQNNAILCLSETEAHVPEPGACIRCGRCVSGCPMHLMPLLLEKYTIAKRTDQLNGLNIMDCVECGCCSYNCPAGRPIVQAIRLGKSLVGAEGGK